MENQKCSICKFECGMIHEGNRLYTEDKILIYNITVYVPGCIDENDLKEYFIKFGKIDELRTLKTFKCYRADERRDYLATIRFNDFESATRSLTDRVQMLKIFRTTKSESWLQPDYKPGCLFQKINPLLKKSNTNNYLISETNEDCLFYICENLPLNEHIKLFKLSEKFQNNFIPIYRHNKSIYLDENCLTGLTTLQIREAISVIGPYLENFEFSNKYLNNGKKIPPTTSSTTVQQSRTNWENENYIIDFLIEFCDNLKILKFHSIHRQDDYIWDGITERISYLTELQIINSSINDKIIKILIQNEPFTKNLKKLDLSQNTLLTGLYLNKFPNLLELNLSDCDHIDSSNFIKICELSQNLLKLNISNCIHLDTLAFRRLIQLCKNIENLTITTNYSTTNMEIILELRNLKHISISESYSMTEQYYSLPLSYFIERLVAKKSQTLETFKLYTDNNLDENGLGAILSLRQLRELHLEGCCYHRYFWFALAMLNKLKILNLHGNYNFFQPECYNYIAKAKSLDKVYLRWGSPDKMAILKTINAIKRCDDQKALYLKIRIKDKIRDEIIKDPEYLSRKRNVCLDFFNETDNNNYLEYPFVEHIL